jgi:nucleotide-binding universal stress UspA family protein
MRKVEKILVPIDFSEESARALRHALALAMETRAELIALHVVEPYSLRDYFASSLASLEDSPFPGNNAPVISIDALLHDKTLDLSNFIAKTAQGTSRIKITKKVRMGSIVEGIAATTEEENIDLIVLELRKRFLFPDLATLKALKIMRKLPCPLLLDPPIAEDRSEPRKPLLLLQTTQGENIA